MRTAAKMLTVLGRKLTVAQQYDAELLGIQTASLIDYWKLADLSGTTAVDTIATARNGTYSGATPNGGIWNPSGGSEPCASFDGTTDGVNIYSAGLNTVFSGAAGTFACWFKVSAAGVWTDSTLRRILRIFVDGSNSVSILKQTTSNTLTFVYVAGGTSEQLNATYSATTWTHVAITWDKTAEEMKAYLNGVQNGATQTALGTWAGSLSSTSCVIGASTTAYDNSWSGNIARVALWTVALSSAQVAQIASAP